MDHSAFCVSSAGTFPVVSGVSENMANNTFKAKKRLDYKKSDFTATDIELNFDLADEYTVVRSTAHYLRLTSDTKAPLRLKGEDLDLQDVLLNGQPCKYSISDKGTLVVPEVPDDFELTTECVIAPASNTSLMGLYKSCGVFCTQCEPEGFRRITYFLDRPDVLAKYRVTIVGPEYGCGVLLSNGNLVESGVKNGRNYAVWEDPFPKPSYLFALVAGTFDIIEDRFITRSGREVQLTLYVDRGAYNRGLWAMQSVKEAMAWDERRFNLEYDLDNFKVVAVDFFNFGAMENKSLNIFNSSCVLVDPETATDNNYYHVQGVIGHEYFHNYTGDRVTLRDWFQLSLKESLTVFRDQEFSSDVNSRILTRLEAIDLIRSRQFAEDAGPMAHPVRPEQVMEMNNFYTVTIYDKGAEVIRMIHTILGEEKFQKGVAEYLNRFDGSAATIEDFILTMESAAMTDLMQFRRWYSQAGTPEVYARWDFTPIAASADATTALGGEGDAAAAAADTAAADSAPAAAGDRQLGTLTLTLVQNTPPTPGQKTKEPFVIPVRTSFLTPTGAVPVPPELPESGVLMFTEAEQSFKFSNIPEGTIPVLFRDFSAPVKLQSVYTEADYINMLEHCDDAFIRIDAHSSLINDYIHQNIDKAESGDLPVPTAIINAVKTVINDSKLDLQLKARLITIPNIISLMETFKKISLDALALTRKKLESALALALVDDYAALEHQTRSVGKYHYDEASAARRAVHAAAQYMAVLGWITRAAVTDDAASAAVAAAAANATVAGESAVVSSAEAKREAGVNDSMRADDLISDAYDQANNMTDRFAAINTAVQLDLPCKNSLLDRFVNSYSGDPLTFDKFFSMQASVSSEDTVNVVRKLLKHPRFDITNPNRVRALAGTFGYSNPVALHRRDGMGYLLMFDLVKELDGINSSVAARILDGMINYHRLDPVRKAKAEEYLNRIKNIEGLSRAVYEKVSAALEQEQEH